MASLLLELGLLRALAQRSNVVFGPRKERNPIANERTDIQRCIWPVVASRGKSWKNWSRKC